MARKQTHDWNELREAAEKNPLEEQERKACKHVASKIRSLRAWTKYGVVAMTAYFTLHGLLMLMGVDHFALHLIGVVFLLYMAWKLSSLFNLCLLHKMCVLYICVMMAVLLHDTYEGKSIMMYVIRHLLVTAGAYLLIGLLYNTCKDRKDETNS